MTPAESGRLKAKRQPSTARLCRTPEECYAAGWEDGADDAPLTQSEIERLVTLHSPYLQAEAEAS